jgi:catalase
MAVPDAAPVARAPVDMAPSPALSILNHGQPTMAGRRVAILFAAGSNKDAIETLKSQIEEAGASVALVAPRVGKIAVKGGTLQADGQLAGNPSVLFDAVASIIMPDAAQALARDSAAHGWFADAYAHCKTIGACPATKALLDGWGMAADAGVVPIADFAAVAPARHWDREPGLRMLA